MTGITAARKEQKDAPAPGPRQTDAAGGCKYQGSLAASQGRRELQYQRQEQRKKGAGRCPDKPESPGAVISDKLFIPLHVSFYGPGDARPCPWTNPPCMEKPVRGGAESWLSCALALFPSPLNNTSALQLAREGFLPETTPPAGC